MKLGRDLSRKTRKGYTDEGWSWLSGAGKDPMGDIHWSVDLARFNDIQVATTVMRKRAQQVMAAATRQGFQSVKGNWRWLRLNVSLQFRLFVEQCFWVMGNPWRSLISGFKPIE